jgi:hypothetical protein
MRHCCRGTVEHRRSGYRVVPSTRDEPSSPSSLWHEADSVDLSSLDFLVIQIDGIHMGEDLILIAAISVDATRPVPMPPQPR